MGRQGARLWAHLGPPPVVCWGGWATGISLGCQLLSSPHSAHGETEAVTQAAQVVKPGSVPALSFGEGRKLPPAGRIALPAVESPPLLWDAGVDFSIEFGR